MTVSKNRAEHVAAEFIARWERAWNSDGPVATAQLYTEDSVLVGVSIAIGRAAIGRSLGMLFAAGWTTIAIKLVNVREVGGLVLAACEFTARGSGPNEGKVLNGRSSHALVNVDGAWFSAMHSAA
jgi:uncharacterized protein (TIGR02246 family)